MKHTLKIGVIMLATFAFHSCKKDAKTATSPSVKFEHCGSQQTPPAKTAAKTTAPAANFVAIGPFNGIGAPYYHGLSGAGFPLTPMPSPGGDNIIRDAATTNPLLNVTGIATEIARSKCYVLCQNTAGGPWEVWRFPVGDPNNARFVFKVSGGGTSLSDLEFDFNFSASPGSTRFIALDRSNNSLIEINMTGTVLTSTNYYTSMFPLPASETVTGLAWFNCTPTGPFAHSHPFLLSHDASGTGHIWKCTDNTLENGWSIGAAEYTFGNLPSSPAAEFGTYFDHGTTLHFIIANDANENTEAVPAGGPNTPFTMPYAGSTDPIIDMAEL